MNLSIHVRLEKNESLECKSASKSISIFERIQTMNNMDFQEKDKRLLLQRIIELQEGTPRCKNNDRELS